MKQLSKVQITIIIVTALLFAICAYKQGIINMIVGLAAGAGISYYFIYRFNKKENMTPEQQAQEIKRKNAIKNAKLEAKAKEEKTKAEIASYKRAAKTAKIPPLVCPKCGSTNVKPLKTDKKFSWGKAAGGTLLAGNVGSLAGYTGKETGKTIFVCMNCGKQFKK